MNSVKVKVQDISFISETVNRLHDMFLQCTLLLDLKILETWTHFLACDYAMALHSFHNSIPIIQSWTILNNVSFFRVGEGVVRWARRTKHIAFIIAFPSYNLEQSLEGVVRRARSTKRMKAQIFNMLQTWLTWVKVTEKERWGIKTRKKWGEKMTVTQGGTRTRNLANGLPCSNQPSYRVSRALQNLSQGRLFFILGRVTSLKGWSSKVHQLAL